jgi:hypothetical protein
MHHCGVSDVWPFVFYAFAPQDKMAYLIGSDGQVQMNTLHASMQ